MHFFINGSIRKILTLLVLLAIVPALVIILYSGLELRRMAIENTKREVLFLAQTMGEAQKGITHSTHQILATLAQTHAVRAMDSQRTSAILRSVVYKNPAYLNVIAVDLNGEIVASGRPVEPTNLADRSHIQRALSEKKFIVGDYVVRRTTPHLPTLAFTYPLLDAKEEVIGVLAATLDLDDFAKFFNVTALPLDSFVAVTDRNGTRLFYYPPREGTHPIGRPIVGKVWEAVKNAREPGITIDHGSDGMRRIMAFQPVRLDGEEAPY
ncbi:MAG: cache domain-containing protein, partial [Desulfatitalea sp.]|nr:cache domain-containing protein [Desulfatitalea sp.]